MKHFLAILFSFMFTACAPADAAIDLNQLEPLPTVISPNADPLRVAIAAVISPQGTLESYAPFLNYLETKLGRPVERVQSSTYAEANEVLQSGAVDLAFVCTGAYLKGLQISGWRSWLYLRSLGSRFIIPG